MGGGAVATAGAGLKSAVPDILKSEWGGSWFKGSRGKRISRSYLTQRKPGVVAHSCFEILLEGRFTMEGIDSTRQLYQTYKGRFVKVKIFNRTANIFPML
jgi:hypothetical protein